MSNFAEVLSVEDLPPGRSTTVEVDGKEVALFNVEGQIFATDDTCPHAGASLGWGKLEDKVVTCRAHGLAIDVTTGRGVRNPAIGVATYAAKVEDGKILIAIGGPT
jgi:nitrite reductase/ring-hydroxylating ferredoxin subunit